MGCVRAGCTVTYNKPLTPSLLLVHEIHSAVDRISDCDCTLSEKCIRLGYGLNGRNLKCDPGMRWRRDERASVYDLRQRMCMQSLPCNTETMTVCVLRVWGRVCVCMCV